MILALGGSLPWDDPCLGMILALGKILEILESPTLPPFAENSFSEKALLGNPGNPGNPGKSHIAPLSRKTVFQKKHFWEILEILEILEKGILFRVSYLGYPI